MASALPTTDSASIAPATPAPDRLGNFRDTKSRDVDASDSDQSNASARSLSPTRQGLSKTKKKKERRQFGAFADELGDLLGAAFQSKDEPRSASGDLEMQVEPTSAGPKMSKCVRLHYCSSPFPFSTPSPFTTNAA